MFPLRFKICGAVFALKMMNFSMKNEKKKLFFWKFYSIHHPKRHIIYKIIDFASSNLAIMGNSLLQPVRYIF